MDIEENKCCISDEEEFFKSSAAARHRGVAEALPVGRDEAGRVGVQQA